MFMRLNNIQQKLNNIQNKQTRNTEVWWSRGSYPVLVRIGAHFINRWGKTILSFLKGDPCDEPGKTVQWSKHSCSVSETDPCPYIHTVTMNPERLFVCLPRRLITHLTPSMNLVPQSVLTCTTSLLVTPWLTLNTVSIPCQFFLIQHY